MLSVDPAEPVVIQAIVGMHPFENARKPSPQDHAVKGSVLGLVLAKFQLHSRYFAADFEPGFPSAAGFPLYAAAQRQFVKVVQQRAVQSDSLQFFLPAVVLFLMVLFLQNRLANQVIPLSVRFAEGVGREVQSALASQRELSFVLNRFHQALGVSQDIELLVCPDAEAQHQLGVRVFNSRFQPDRAPRLPDFFGLLLRRVRSRGIPVTAPEAVQEFSGLLVGGIPIALVFKLFDGLKQQGEAVLADLRALSAHIVVVVAFAPIHRAVHPGHSVPGDGDAYRIIVAAFEIAPGHQHLSAAPAVRAVAVLHFDVAQRPVLQQLLRLPVGIGIDLDVSGKALGHVVAVFSRGGRFCEGIDFHMPRHHRGGFLLASRAGNFPRDDFIQCRRHVLAAASVLGIGALAAHELNPVSLNPDLHLVLFCPFHGCVIEVSVLDQGAYLILFVILPSALKNRSREEMLPLEHVSLPPAFSPAHAGRWPDG